MKKSKGLIKDEARYIKKHHQSRKGHSSNIKDNLHNLCKIENQQHADKGTPFISSVWHIELASCIPNSVTGNRPCKRKLGQNVTFQTKQHCLA